ncbi:DUF368 domain-containing protein [Salibacterium qingdaonense]|uniref:Putative membrane protein n=1 Tax=Salibacterium qingdaonense TaxID=266892 RepID=A0A1I4QAZ7_9BACI|nr:DUF368 domain-containing protein [Salibacterium qingdaonense]SFM37217.1 putative membrane protein [Salibacterium qingdaonense]
MFEWKNIFRGLAMGISDIIPGVSGGTIALVLGIYHRLIAAINNLFSRHWKEQLGFFIPLGIGIVAAIFSLSSVLDWLLGNYPQPTFFLFMGLILGTIPLLLREADYKRAFNGSHYVIAAIAAVLVILSGLFRGEEGEAMQTLAASDYLLFFFSGWIASTAMILPGISGSFILLLLGVYSTVIHAVSSLQFSVLLAVGAGIVVGLAIMSKLLHYLLRRHTAGTYAVMTGLLIGSLFVIFPGLGAGVVQFFVSLFTFAAGLVIAAILGKVERR